MNTAVQLIFMCFLPAALFGCQQDHIISENNEKPMQVTIISLEKCSATGPTIALVEETAREMGIAITLEHIIVRTAAEAELYSHVGSPTVQIEGIDIEPQARSFKRFGIS
jgi:hypothetical protein